MNLRDRAMQGVPGFLMMHVYGLPHCPRNRSHAIKKKGKAHFLGKTEAAHEYEKALLFHLAKYKAHAEAFKAHFNPEKNHLVAVWEFFSPEVKTKSGKYSETGTDLDAHKVLQDTVMGFVGINDAYIIVDSRCKIQGDYAFSVSLAIGVNNPDTSVQKEYPQDGSDLL